MGEGGGGVVALCQIYCNLSADHEGPMFKQIIVKMLDCKKVGGGGGGYTYVIIGIF